MLKSAIYTVGYAIKLINNVKSHSVLPYKWSKPFVVKYIIIKVIIKNWGLCIILLRPHTNLRNTTNIEILSMYKYTYSRWHVYTFTILGKYLSTLLISVAITILINIIYKYVYGNIYFTTKIKQLLSIKLFGKKLIKQPIRLQIEKEPTQSSLGSNIYYFIFPWSK